jgi:hypothetical protein
LYNPATDTFTAIANTIPTPFTCPQGAASTVSAISEVGNTVTVTMATANPPGLTVGQLVNVKNVVPNAYDGNFTVATIPDGTHFTYSDPTSGLAAGAAATSTIMTATSLTQQCGMVDQGAALIPNSGGKVLLAGGDQIVFLGQATTASYIFDPVTQTFTQTGSMTAPRELFPLIPLDTPVTGTLAGKLVAMGGINSNSSLCPTTTSPALVTTNSDGEVFDPNTQTWTTVSGAPAAISSLSESGNTVTVTMTTANPVGLTVGRGVSISGVTQTTTLHFENFGYDGAFVVASIPDSTHFTYNDRFSGLAAATGGTAIANTMGERRTTDPTFFLTGPLAGEVILPGGVQVEAGNFAAGSCVAVTAIKQAALQESDLYDPVSNTQGVFVPTGSLNQAREGQGQGIIGGVSADAGDLLVAGGACTTNPPSLQSITIGTTATSSCNNTGGAGSALNDYSELYSQSTQTWTVGPGPAVGFTPTNAPAFAVLQ